MKKYIVIAGVNGAGKSTLYQTLETIKQIDRINTDEIVRSFGNWKNADDVIKAGKIAVKKIEEYFRNGISFNQETTLCGNSIINNIIKAKNLGYKIEVHYIGVESIEIAKERIAYRVEHGGHGIPNADVERRYYESFEHLRKIMNICDVVILYDNTEAFNRFAIFHNGETVMLSKELPGWYGKYLK